MIGRVSIDSERLEFPELHFMFLLVFLQILIESSVDVLWFFVRRRTPLTELISLPHFKRIL